MLEGGATSLLSDSFWLHPNASPNSLQELCVFHLSSNYTQKVTAEVVIKIKNRQLKTEAKIRTTFMFPQTRPKVHKVHECCIRNVTKIVRL